LNLRFWLICQIQYLANNVIGIYGELRIINRLLPKRIDGINVYNLWRLRRYVLANVSDNMFDMERFYEKNECGTVGCLLGYTPIALANIIDMKSWRDHHSWSLYGKESFNMANLIVEFSFLFSSDWTPVDNTRLGACERIKYVILNDNFNYNIDFFGTKRCMMWRALYNSN